jgi:hypothetical protein
MKIFITGAAGYIGGSITEKLVASGHKVTGLAKSGEQVLLLKARGIDSVVGTLDDPEILTKAAQSADAVINAASADHPGSIVTLVTALERSGKLLIHTTGSAIVADHADGEFSSSVALTEDSYFEPVPYRRPRVDLNRYVRQAAIGKGVVRSIVICPAMIYGTGRGLQPNSDQIPKLIGLSKQAGAGVYFGKGLNRYSNVHVDDLVDLGNNSFKEIAEMISNCLGLGGKTTGLPLADVILQYGEAAVWAWGPTALSAPSMRGGSAARQRRRLWRSGSIPFQGPERSPSPAAVGSAYQGLAHGHVAVFQRKLLNPCLLPERSCSSGASIMPTSGLKMTGAASKAADLGGERPLPSIARFGRLAYPMRGEVTNRVLLGCKRHGRPGTHIGGQRWERPGWQANSEA